MLREFEELVALQHHLHAVTHSFREANTPVDRLANIGTDSSLNMVYDSVVELPGLVRGDFKMDNLGIPSIHLLRS